MPEFNKFQHVSIILQMCGDYCAFHEMSFYVMYDITNNLQLSDMTLEEIKEDMSKDYHNYCDMMEIPAILIDGKYYYNL